MADYYPVNAIFTDAAGISFRVVVDENPTGDDCARCHMRGRGMCENFECTNTERADNRNVHFIRINDAPSIVVPQVIVEDSDEPPIGSVITLENGARLRVDLDSAAETCHRCDLQEYGGECGDYFCDERHDGATVHFVYIGGIGLTTAVESTAQKLHAIPTARNDAVCDPHHFCNIRPKDA